MTLPALRMGLLNDDWHHWGVLAGTSRLGQDLSRLGIAPEDSGRLSTALSEQFAPVDPQRNLSELKNYGALPWWTYDGLRVCFWRPLSSFTHWLDYRVFGNSVVMMRVHNFVWLAVVMFLVATLYRRLMTPLWMAGLAALLYVLDDSSYFPAMWIANRNIFLSLFFGILGLLAHHRWRRDNSTPAGIASVLCLLCSLLSAEAGVAAFAYIFAYALALERGSRLRRGLSLAPAVLVIVLWRIIYNMLGRGASGGGFYSNPSSEPLRYLQAVLVRGPILLMGQWSCLPADIFSYMHNSAKMVYFPFIVVFVVLVLIVLLPLLRVNRLARFWLAGMYFSVLPICATTPMNRNLLFVGLGAFGLIAQFTGGIISKESWLPKSRIWRASAWALCVILLFVHLPITIFGRVITPRATTEVIVKVNETMEIDTADFSREQVLVVVNAPNPASLFYIPFQKACKAEPLPRAMRFLVPGFAALEVTRKDDKSLSVRAASGNLLSSQPGPKLDMVYLFESVSVVRGAGNRMHLGRKVELPGFSAEVVAVDGQGVPVEVLLKFAVSLDDPSLRWFWWRWKKDHYYPFKVPAVGEPVNIPGPFR